MQRIIVVEGAAQVIPSSVTLTGTYSSSGTLVTGTGTDFVSEMLINGAGGALKYKYLFSETQCQLIEIVAILSPTTLQIKQAFDSDVSGDDLIVDNPADGMTSFKLNPIGGEVGVANINQSKVAIDKTTHIEYKNSNGLTPIAIDGTSNIGQVVIE